MVGPPPLARAVERFGHRLVGRDRAEAVAHHARQAVARRLVRDVGDLHLLVLRRRDRPLVVLDEEHDREAVDRGVVDRLVPLALGRRAFTVAADHGAAGLAAIPERGRDAHGVRAVPRDDGRDRQHAQIVVRVVVGELPPHRTIGLASEQRREDLERAHPDAQRQPEIAIVRDEHVLPATEGRRRAGLDRFVAFGAQRERDLPLAVELKAAVVELALQQHVAEHRDELFVAQTGAVELPAARGRRFRHRVDPLGPCEVRTADTRARGAATPAEDEAAVKK